MAIKKSILLSPLTRAQILIVKEIENKIDSVLAPEWNGDYVFVELGEWPEKRVREEIKFRYKEALWEIEFISREGCSVRLR